MIIAENEARDGPKWFTSSVTTYEGTLKSIQGRIPLFVRQPFGHVQPGTDVLRYNNSLDSIVRCPTESDNTYVPVGVVSKTYALIQHREILDEAVAALQQVGIDSGTVAATLTLTEFGERMELSFRLPSEYDFKPRDGHPMALRLECFNSVDGSTRFRALMGWFRLVCSNGLVIGVTRSDVHRRHTGDLGPSEIQEVLKAGVDECQAEIARFHEWQNHDISLDSIGHWVDKQVRKRLNFKAAARTYHIARTGFDAEVAGNYKERTPSTIEMKATVRVPGAPALSTNLFDLSQVLAWLATRRRDVQEQLAWREMIVDIMSPLTRQTLG